MGHIFNWLFPETQCTFLLSTNDSLALLPANESFLLLFCVHPRTWLLILRERKGTEREGKKHRCGKTCIGCLWCMHPDQDNPQHRHMPWLRTKPVTFWFMGWRSNQLSHTNQHWWILLNGFIQFYSLSLHSYEFIPSKIFPYFHLWSLEIISCHFRTWS